MILISTSSSMYVYMGGGGGGGCLEANRRQRSRGRSTASTRACLSISSYTWEGLWAGGGKVLAGAFLGEELLFGEGRKGGHGNYLMNACISANYECLEDARQHYLWRGIALTAWQEVETLLLLSAKRPGDSLGTLQPTWWHRLRLLTPYRR